MHTPSAQLSDARSIYFSSDSVRSRNNSSLAAAEWWRKCPRGGNLPSYIVDGPPDRRGFAEIALSYSRYGGTHKQPTLAPVWGSLWLCCRLICSHTSWKWRLVPSRWNFFSTAINCLFCSRSFEAGKVLTSVWHAAGAWMDNDVLGDVRALLHSSPFGALFTV